MLKRFNLLVSLCFKRSQSQRIISGLKKTFVKRYIVERTNKGEIRPQEQSEKAESCRENSWTEIQLKGYKDRNRHKNRIKRIGQVRLVYVKNINRNIRTTWRWARTDNWKDMQSFSKLHGDRSYDVQKEKQEDRLEKKSWGNVIWKICRASQNSMATVAMIYRRKNKRIGWREKKLRQRHLENMQSFAKLHRRCL